MIKRFILGIIFVLGIPLSAKSQDTTPLIGSQATEPQTDLVAPILSDGIYRILVIGDSLAGGLGAGMARVAANEEGFEVVSRFNESSGLTRPDVYDWARAIPKIMDGKNFNAVVVLIGMNDRQDIRNEAGQFTFNSAEWIKAYQTNTSAIADALKTQNVKVFWLGEPPMGNPAYDADMQIVAALQKDSVVAKGLNYINTRPLLLASDGSYMDFGPDDTGEMRKLRQKDGVTFFKQGNNKFGQLILAAIKANANGTVSVPEIPVALAPTSEIAPSNPIFGQSDGNGGAVVQDTDDVVALANPAETPVEPANIKAPASGSAAEKLFTKGEATVAPLGRFDDFSYVAPTAN
jgi:uncharacterized protein